MTDLRTAAINLWQPAPDRRTRPGRRHRPSSVLAPQIDYSACSRRAGPGRA